MEIETTEQLEELLASIVLNRGNFRPSQVLKALAKVCDSNANDPNMSERVWQDAATIIQNASRAAF